MQTILGSNGAISYQLALALSAYTSDIRLVATHPRRVNGADLTVKADLLNLEEVYNAVEGSKVVYLVDELKFSAQLWEKEWPVIMLNALKACKRFNAKLVFFDNVYLYGQLNGWMTEDTPVAPVSRKGRVRADISATLMNDIKQGYVNGIIAHAADLYGPEATPGLVNDLIIERLKANKAPQWPLNDKVRHSFTFAPDAAKALALLGNTEAANNQVWHLPTHRAILTANEFIKQCIAAFGANLEHKVISEMQLRIAGMFNPIIKENIEMQYQYKYNYLFDSSKFENAFNTSPTPYAEGIRQTVTSAKTALQVA